MFDITAEKAAAAAQLSFAGTPEHAIAVQLCRLRGINPDGWHDSNVVNWQAVIAEQILETTLRHALQRASQAKIVPFQ